MQLGQLYRQVRDQFRGAAVTAADLEAKLLITALLNVSVSDLVLDEARQLSTGDEARVLEAVRLRLGGMPVGRILGAREFYGRSFKLNRATLEPRPDTETLVDAVLARSAADAPLLIYDIGTGTGAIAVTLLAERPKSRVVAIDLSEEALGCALENAQLHGVADRFIPVCGDYLSAFGACRKAGPDWIVSNPPYIRSAVLQDLDREVLEHDPFLALDGGDSGLEAYLRIVAEAAGLIAQGTRIALEIGWDQGEDVKKQLRLHGFGAIEIIKDLARNDRVVLAGKI